MVTKSVAGMKLKKKHMGANQLGTSIRYPSSQRDKGTRGGGIRQELAARITRLQRANHLLGAAIAGRSCNITDATPKVIAVAKVRANIVIHICSSIAWQAGAQPVSQPPAPGKEPQPMIRTACAYYWRQATHFFAIRKTCHSLAMLAGPCNLSLFQLFTNSGAEDASCAAR